MKYMIFDFLKFRILGFLIFGIFDFPIFQNGFGVFITKDVSILISYT